MASGGVFDTQHNIGLGANSTFLTALQKSGNIASSVWSWYWGKDFATPSAQMAGSLILGGYDKAKTIGPASTQNMVPREENCQSGMRVTISDLKLDLPNSTTSLLGHKQISACLQPDFPVLMTLPEDPYYNAFESLTHMDSVGSEIVDGITAGPLYLPDELYVVLSCCFTSTNVSNNFTAMMETLQSSSAASSVRP